MPRPLASIRSPHTGFCLLLTLTIFACFLMAAPVAHAQDQVGIYWDAAYTTDVATTPTIPGAITGYVVLNDPTGTGGVLGWEACIDIDGPGMITGWDFPGQAVNVGSAPCLVVGYTAPLPQSENILLATFTAYANDTGPIELTMKPLWSASIPNEMSYIPGDAPGDLIAMQTVTGREVVAGLNGGNPWLTFNSLSLDFGAPALGETVSRNLIISNDGPNPVTVAPSIQEFCDFFGLPGGNGPFTVPTFGSLTIEVTFTPVQERQISCSLDLGPNLPVISLIGAGTAPVTSWYISGSPNFGSVDTGTTRTRTVQLINSGQTVIPLDVAFLGSCPDFTLNSGGGVLNLQPGSSVAFSVTFSPSIQGYQACTLDLGNSQVGTILFDGYGTGPALSWEAPTAYNFLGQFVGVPTTATLTITNNGSLNFDIVASLPGNCEAFSILQGGGYLRTLQPGQSHALLVEFNAPEPGHFRCDIDLGSTVPAIRLDGDGIAAATSVTATPSQLVFPGTLIGLSAERDVILTNTVSYDVPIDVQIAAPDSAFSVVAGGGARVLASGTSLTVTVRFTPGNVADYNNALSLGSSLDSVPLQGSGFAGSPDCRIEPTALNFGSVSLGSSRDLPVTITNDGAANMLLEFSTTDAAFFIDEAPALLAPGQQRTVTVRYQPTTLGGHSGLLLLGSTSCNAVSLLGNAVIDSNLFTISPDTVTILPVGLGVAVDREVLLTNLSGGAIDLNVQLQTPTVGFSLLQGAGPRTLYPGDSHLITLRFQSATAQTYATGLYLGAGLPIVPLFAESAVIEPDCVLSEVNVNFGEVAIGQSLARSVGVTNNTDNPMVLSPSSDSPQFMVAPDSVIIAPGATASVTVSFAPDDVVPFSGAITLGPAACGQINCFGSGIASQGSGEDLLGIYFDTGYQQNFVMPATVGEVIEGYLVLSNPSNTGGVLGWECKVSQTGPALVSGWALAGQSINLSTAPEFIVGLSTPLPYTDDALLASFTCLVTSLNEPTYFRVVPVQTPSLPDAMAWVPGDLPNAILPMRPVAGASLVAAIGDDPSPFTISPDTLNFPAVPVGTIVDKQVRFTNRSDAIINLNVRLLDPTYGFTLLGGGGTYPLAPGSTRLITVRFQCLTPQTYATALALGNNLPTVPIFGEGVIVQLDCDLSTTNLSYGNVAVGTVRWHEVGITNNSGAPLILTPTSSSPAFLVAADTLVIAPDSTRTLAVGFAPQEVRPYAGNIDLGATSCADIGCAGTGVATQNLDQDLLGIYFDSFYQENFIFSQGVGQVVNGYLVLSNPSNPGGVLGWECQVDLTGSAVFTGWTLAGEAINLRSAPEFIVGLNEPLPFDPLRNNSALLASFSCVVVAQGSDAVFSVTPVRTPSLPDEMAWIPGDLPGALLPMHPVLGQPEVAFITENALGIAAPTPVAEVLGGQVDLSWPLPLALNDGCHVYRRLDGADPVRLTSEPVAASGQQFMFTDATGGLAPGSKLFYSYAIVSGGNELARSAEVEVTLPGLPATVTRLLPNVPNPFNPMTEIRFELHKPQAVSLRIYDVTGRLVRDLVSGSLPAGPHARVWQGRDNRGRQVPSGAYYVRLVTEGRVDKTKIMLLK